MPLGFTNGCSHLEITFGQGDIAVSLGKDVDQPQPVPSIVLTLLKEAQPIGLEVPAVDGEPIDQKGAGVGAVLTFTSLGSLAVFEAALAHVRAALLASQGGGHGV